MNTTDKPLPRIQPLPMSDMREDWLNTLERIPGKGLKGPLFPVNVMGTLMYNPQTMGPFLEYWVGSKHGMGFSVREQELVILRIGYHYRCNYVWKHHVPVHREFGGTEAELGAVRTDQVPGIFSEREMALLHLTDEMVNHRTIRQEAWDRWSGLLKKSELVDLVSLVSQYVLFALLNNSFQLEIEEPLADIPAL